MPSEWRATTLGEVITLQRGFDLPTQNRRPGPVPVVSSAGTSDHHAEARVRAPGVVTGRYGTIGRVYCLTQDFWPLNTTLYVRDFKGNDVRFVSYFLQTIDFASCSDKAAVPGVNRNHLHQLNVRVPSPSEQRTIARILGALDDKIELNRKMNETLEQMARAIFKSWFVDFEPFRDKGMVDSPLGKIPKGWKVVTVSDVCDAIFSGGTPSTLSPDYWNGSIPWLSSGETRAKFIVSTEKTITPAGVENSSTRLARAGTTVIAGAGQGYTRGQTSLLMLDSYINQSVVGLSAKRTLMAETHLFFDLERRYEEFRQLSDAHSSRGSLTTKLIGGQPFALPPRELLSKFERTVTPATQLIASNLRQSRTLAAIRDALLPKLMSGEIRVSDSERHSPEAK